MVPQRALIIGNMRCTWKKNEMNMKNKCYKASGEGFGRRLRVRDYDQENSDDQLIHGDLVEYKTMGC